MDILEVIDQAVGGCHECGGTLQDSPSDDFCGDGCQQAWHAARADELVGYREPWDRPEDFPPGVIPPEAFEDGMPALQPMTSAEALRLAEQFSEGLAAGIRGQSPPEFRLPRSTGNLAADCAAARLALLAATTDEQRAAVRLRMESLAERQWEQSAELARQLDQAFAPLREAMAALAEAGATWMQQIGEQMRPYFEGLRRAGLVDVPAEDPRDRALAAGHNWNADPQSQRLHPSRSIVRRTMVDP